MQENKLCLLCTKPLLGRSDKKFCSEFCRNTLNNKVTSQSRLGMRSAQSILSRNRKILREIIGDDLIKKVPQATLISMGYHFDYLTCMKITQKGEINKYCFEFNIRELSDEMIEIFR